MSKYRIEKKRPLGRHPFIIRQTKDSLSWFIPTVESYIKNVPSDQSPLRLLNAGTTHPIRVITSLTNSYPWLLRGVPTK